MNEQQFLDLLFRRISRPWVTYIVVALNLAVFAICVLRGGNPLHLNSAMLIETGAMYGPLVWQGQTWRMASALFLHGGALHIGLNLFALWQAGALLERLYGHRTYLFIYLGAGLAGSAASLWWKPEVLSVGASGAIFGLYGALLAYLLCQRGRVPVTLTRELRSSATAFIGFSLFAGFSMPGIDNAAHIGGLIGGGVLGAGFAHPLDAGASLRVWLRGALASVALVAAGWALWLNAQPVVANVRQQVQVQQSIQAFAEADQSLVQRTDALLNAAQRGTLDRDRLRTSLEHDLLPAWQAQIDMLASQPEGDPSRDDLLHYAEARRDAVAALARGVETNEQHWLDLAANHQLQAENILLRMRLRQATAVGKQK